MKPTSLTACMLTVGHGCVGLSAGAEHTLPPPRVPVASHDLYAVHPLRVTLRNDGQSGYRIENIGAVSVWDVLVYCWPELLGALAGASFLLGVWFWFRRRRGGRYDVGTPYCRRCGYSLHGVVAQQCPECGAERSRYQKVHRRAPKWRAWLAYGVLSLPVVGYGWLHVQGTSRMPAAADWLQWDSTWLYTLDSGPLNVKKWIWEPHTPRYVNHFALREFDVASPYPARDTLLNTGRQRMEIAYDRESDQLAILCDRDMRLWDATTRRWLGHLTRPGEPDRRARHHSRWWPGPGGELRLTTYHGDRHFWTWDFTAGRVERIASDDLEPPYTLDGMQPIGRGPIYQTSDWVIPEGATTDEAVEFRYRAYHRDTGRTWSFTAPQYGWCSFSSDGNVRYRFENLRDGFGRIEAWDFLTGEKTWEIDLPDGIRVYNSMHLALDDRWLLVHAYGKGVGWTGDNRRVLALDVESRRWVAVFDIDGLGHSPTFWITPDRQTLVAHPELSSNTLPLRLQGFDIGDLTSAPLKQLEPS